jgi:hypothetical protein
LVRCTKNNLATLLTERKKGGNRLSCVSESYWQEGGSDRMRRGHKPVLGYFSSAKSIEIYNTGVDLDTESKQDWGKSSQGMSEPKLDRFVHCAMENLGGKVQYMR